MSERMYERATGVANASAERIRALAEATPQELAQQQQGLTALNAQLESQQRMLAAIDPAIMESSQQILRLLKGESASSLGPLQQQRQQQRQQLLNMLRAQLGPGAETSSAGAKQLQAFDMQTDQMMNSAQQGQLGNLTNVLTGVNSNRPDLAGTAGAGMNLASVFQQRKLAAEQNASGMQLSAITGSAPSLIDTAGAQYVGQQMQGRTIAQLGNSLADFGFEQYGNRNPGNAEKKVDPNAPKAGGKKL
jgi:hypothetical protein